MGKSTGKLRFRIALLGLRNLSNGSFIIWKVLDALRSGGMEKVMKTFRRADNSILILLKMTELSRLFILKIVPFKGLKPFFTFVVYLYICKWSWFDVFWQTQVHQIPFESTEEDDVFCPEWFGLFGSSFISPGNRTQCSPNNFIKRTFFSQLEEIL